MAEEKSSENEKKYLLEHDRPNCIGCGACVAVASEHWDMNNDGKADIINGKNRKDEWREKEITEEEFKINMEAAESCPVNVIHIKRLKDNEKLI